MGTTAPTSEPQAPVAPLGGQQRQLPEDPDELERALRMYRLMASPVVNAASSGFQLAGAEKLSPKETSDGEFAIAAVLYQEGAALDAKMILLLWAASVSAPRLAQLAAQKKKEGASTIDSLPASTDPGKATPEKLAA